MTPYPFTRAGRWAALFVLPLFWALTSLSVQAYTPGPFVGPQMVWQKGGNLVYSLLWKLL